ncbi:MAG: hypothetical protein AAF618_00095 [Pseudomonadota bacterium]
MRRVSLNARMAHEAAFSDELEIVLLSIEHAGLDAPLLLSTDPTTRLGIEPLRYGTRSTWLSGGTAREFEFVGLAAELPDDIEDAPPEAQLVISNVVAGLPKLMRSFQDRPTVNLAVVMATTPDLVEMEYRGLAIVEANGDTAETRLSVTREAVEDETVPMDRFTRARFPGLYR